MSLQTVQDVIRELGECPSDAIVIVYEELHEVEQLLGRCNSGIKVVKDIVDLEEIKFIITGH